jgi:rhodanese-related sulfurtransferase
MIVGMWKRSTAVALFAVAVLGGTTACTSSSATVEAPTSPTAAVAVAESTVIDVRTPEEFDAGHLDGASNINLESADFTSQISALPKDAAYLVYCRSGNRSADAVAQMKQDGFTNVVDIGGLQEASSATGLPVVQ